MPMCSSYVRTKYGVYTKAINKESLRKEPTLFQKILLKKCTSKLIYAMVREDDANNTIKEFVASWTYDESTANKAANYLLEN
jgi:hypothetical protein